jgi:hypothetical protein
MSIYKAIIAAMGDIDPIAKNKKNTMQNYNFRGIDDVYNDLQPILAKHGIFTTSKIIADRTEDRTTSKGSALIYRILTIEWTFFHLDGSFITTQTVGEGMDSGDKASNKAMAVAHKYALLQLFAIPTEDAKDPENESHQVTHKQPPRPSPFAQTDMEKKCILNIRNADSVDRLEEVAAHIAELYPNKTAPLGVKNEYQIRMRELVPQ